MIFCLVSPVVTQTFHGCMLVPDGARLATRRMSRIVSSSTGSGRKARTDRREVIARWRAQGMSLRSLEKRTGWNTNRYTNTEVA